MRRIVILLVAAALSVLPSGVSWAGSGGTSCEGVSGTPIDGSIVDISDLKEVNGRLRSGKPKTLVVFDIDDTLLTSETFFGSDYWYKWQSGLSGSNADSVPCMFDLVSLAYEVGTMKATQEDGPKVVNEISNDMIFLTSRNANYRGGTVRELGEARYRFPPQLGPSTDGTIFSVETTYKSYVDVSYHHGIYMVSGLPKGRMLRDLLRRLKLSYERVLMVDDDCPKLVDVADAVRPEGMEFVGLHYTKIAKPIKVDDALRDSGRAAMRAVSSFVETVFPERAARLSTKKCQY